MQKTNSRTLHEIPGKGARITYETDYALHLHTTTTCTCTRNATYKCTLQKHPAVQYTMIKPAQLTISGGGLPAWCTQYLHMLTISGERSPRARKSTDEHEWAEHRLEIQRTWRGRLREKRRTRWANYTWDFERVNEKRRTCRGRLREIVLREMPPAREVDGVPEDQYPLY